MEHRQEILQELRDISPLIADSQQVNPFTVPQGYFDGLAGSILEKMRIDTLLSNASANTYGIPAGYFERLAGNILSKIQSGSNEIRTELEEVAPLLNTISKQEIYSVPAGYFAQTNFAKVARYGKVITLRVARKWTQYAAAAVMAGVLVTGAFIFTDNRTNLDNEQYQRMDVTSELNKVSDDELVKYVNNPEHAIAAPATTQLASEEELVDVKNNIQQVSDDELKQYLKENAEPFDSVITEKDN